MTGAATGPAALPASLEIDAVSFAYPKGGPRLDRISLSLHPAELCCLLGPNGAGKTTLLRCVLGLLSPAGGRIRVCGMDRSKMSARQLARLVAYLPQNTATPFPFTALDIAVMGRTPHLGLAETPSAADRRVAMAHLENLGIARLADRPFAKLSGGERQLVLLARALVQGARVLVLDEPTAALDYGNEFHLMQVVAGLVREGRSVLMTTHQPAHALSYASRAVLMQAGAIVANGHPDDVVTSEGLSALYGIPILVGGVALPGGGDRLPRACVPMPAPPGGPGDRLP